MDIADPRINPDWVPVGSKAYVVNGHEKQYRDLPCVCTTNGYVITRWTPTDEERQAIMNGEDIFVTLLSAGQINPFFVTVGPVNWKERY